MIPSAPPIDPAAAFVFVVNASSGSNDADRKRAVIETALDTAGRKGELIFARPQDLGGVAREAAATARSRGSAVVAVGGDGTINLVAQAAHAEGCAMGVVPEGTFNYFARTHAIPLDPAEAARALLASNPEAVQVGEVNGRLFLVNASLGLYPTLLQDRETYKSRFGRTRFVALGAALATLLRERRQLRLTLELDGRECEVRTPTLFVGNNRLQLERVGVAEAQSLDAGCVAAVMLRPIGTGGLFWLLVRSAFGTLGGARDVESFDFKRMVVKPRLRFGRRRVKVAVDGEVNWMDGPLEFKVSAKPLYLLKPTTAERPGEHEPESRVEVGLRR